MCSKPLASEPPNHSPHLWLAYKYGSTTLACAGFQVNRVLLGGGDFLALPVYVHGLKDSTTIADRKDKKTYQLRDALIYLEKKSCP